MKTEIARLEEVLKAIAAEDKKRPETLPPNPHLGDALGRGRLMIKSLNRYLAEGEAAKPLEATTKK